MAAKDQYIISIQILVHGDFSKVRLTRSLNNGKALPSPVRYRPDRLKMSVRKISIIV